MMAQSVRSWAYRCRRRVRSAVKAVETAVDISRTMARPCSPTPARWALRTCPSAGTRPTAVASSPDWLKSKNPACAAVKRRRKRAGAEQSGGDVPAPFCLLLIGRTMLQLAVVEGL